MHKPKIIFLLLLALAQIASAQTLTGPVQIASAACPTGTVVTVSSNSGANVMNSFAWALDCLDNAGSNLTTVVFKIDALAEIHPTGAAPLIVPAPSITINGANTGTGGPVTIIGGVAGSPPNGLTIAQPGVTVQDLTIRGFTASAGGNGILIGAANATVQNNTLTGNRIGVANNTGISDFNIMGNIIGASGQSNTTGISIVGVPTGGTILNNSIGYNTGAGITIVAGTVLITNNSIFCNGTSGITRPSPPAIPSITFSNVQLIKGTATANSLVEVFEYSTAGCAGTPVQGKTYLGQATASASGAWTMMPAGAVAGMMVTATSTVNSNNTSAFSPPATLSDCSLTAGIDITNVTCFNAGDGTATATPNDPGFTFQWAGGQTTATRTNLSPGTYTVTVSDAAGCSDSATATITQPPLLSLSLSSMPVSCFGGANGEAKATAGGGTAPYTYLWSNGKTTPEITGLMAGNYMVTLSDANGCTTVQTTTVTGPAAALTLSITASQVSCFAGSNGQATTTASGGTAPYTYLWNNGQTTPGISGLGIGAYSVTLTDAKGCTAMQGTTITQPAALSVNLSPTAESAQLNDGRIVAFPAGGTAPFLFLWNNGSTNDTIAGLMPGTYTVTVTDAHNCTTTGSATVVAFSCLGFQATVSKTDVPCFGSSTGTATAMPGGGVAPFTFLWSNGATTAIATGLEAGNYAVTIKDNNACSLVQTVGITQPALLAININASAETTAGSQDGQVMTVVNGGTPPFSYFWNTGAVKPQLTGLSPALYSVTVTDAQGCTKVASATVAAGNAGGCSARPVYALFAPAQVCAHTKFLLTALDSFPAPGIIQYVWLLPNGSSVVTVEPMLEVTPASGAFSGEYFVQRDSLGCLSIPVGGAEITVVAVDDLYAGADSLLCSVGPVKLEADPLTTGTGTWISLGAATVDDPAKNPTVGRNLQTGANAFVWQVALDGCPQAGADTVVYFLESKPDARDDHYTLQHAFDVAVMEVLLNDGLSGLSDTTLVQISTPNVGNLELISNNRRFRYTVEEDFRGTVTFLYAVCNPASVCNLPCDTATVTIQILNLPTIPTGLVTEDDGPNGRLTIRGITGFSRVEITVVDRWGDLVFLEKNYDNGNPWLGDYKRTGKYLPGGAYYYFLKVYEGSAQFGQTLTGVIHLFNK